MRRTTDEKNHRWFQRLKTFQSPDFPHYSDFIGRRRFLRLLTTLNTKRETHTIEKLNFQSPQPNCRVPAVKWSGN